MECLAAIKHCLQINKAPKQVRGDDFFDEQIVGDDCVFCGIKSVVFYHILLVNQQVPETSSG